MSGNVVDLCPVGALCDKDFLYRQRVWFLSPHAGVCTACAMGCATWIEENQDRVHRVRPRENAQVNKWWMCNDGRDYPVLAIVGSARDARQGAAAGWL
jgi:NADH-quinone oxidoreductase subunit G